MFYQSHGGGSVFYSHLKSVFSGFSFLLVLLINFGKYKTNLWDC